MHSGLALKIVVVRWWHRMGRFLPALGVSVWLLLALTWQTSAGDFLAGAEGSHTGQMIGSVLVVLAIAAVVVAVVTAKYGPTGAAEREAEEERLELREERLEERQELRGERLEDRN